MKKSIYQNYEELPLFLNSETVAKTLGVSPSSAYELMHEPDFPVLRIGKSEKKGTFDLFDLYVEPKRKRETGTAFFKGTF